MAQFETSARKTLDRCWQCDARLRRDQRICLRCGASRASEHMRAVATTENGDAESFEWTLEDTHKDTHEDTHEDTSSPWLEDDDPDGSASDTPVDELPRWYPLASWLLNLMVALGFGALGGLIGAVIWYAAALHFQYESGFLAIPMGYLIGQGVAMGSAERRLLPSALAVALALSAWMICIAMLSAHLLTWSPLDAAYLLVALVLAVAPTRLLPQRMP